MPSERSRAKIRERTARDLGKAKKAREALRLRIEGATVREIAERLGYRGPAEAWSAIREARAEIPPETVASLRALMAERLEVAFRGVMKGVVAGDLDSISAAVQISARLSKLVGLDATPGGANEIPVGRMVIARPDAKR